MNARERLAAIAARRADVENIAAGIERMPKGVTHNVATIASLGTAAALSSNDVPALMAFATAVLDLSDRFEREDDSYSPRSAQVAAAKIANLADQHLGAP